VSERIPGSPETSSYHFQQSVKKAPLGEGIVSPTYDGEHGLEAVLAWSVRWVLSVPIDTALKRTHVDGALVTTYIHSQGPTFVLYRRQMIRLLAWPKPAFDQLMLELPCLMGFREEELRTWRAEYIRWQEGETQVLDARRHTLETVPLNTLAARHAETVLHGRGGGLVLRRRRHTSLDPGRPISRTAFWFTWAKWTVKAGLPNASEISPLVGRRFFAAEWYYGQGLSLVTLQRILRHACYETTIRYVRSLVFFEDVKRDYDRFQLKLMQEVAPHAA